MAYTGVLHPVFIAPFLVTQVNALRAVFRFRSEKAS